MGDRATVDLYYGEEYGHVYLYTHWNGYQTPQIVAHSLDRMRTRWNDDAYLARGIAADFFFLNDGHKDETGSGLSPYPTESVMLRVNLPQNVVTLADPNDFSDWKNTGLDGEKTYSFTDFIDEVNAAENAGTLEALSDNFYDRKIL